MKLNKLEKEIENLKILVAYRVESKEVTPLGGMLKGISVSEEDFTEAKKSLFR